MALYTLYYQSPVGRLEISSDEEAITSLLFADAAKRPGPQLPATATTPVLEQCCRELTAYFSGAQQPFTVPYRLMGSPFQLKVWQELTNIPYGDVITYGEQARRLNSLKAIRAVGTTNGANKLNILVPCHRVVGASGKLTGYAGDLWAKQWLLDHERKHSQTGQMRLF